MSASKLVAAAGALLGAFGLIIGIPALAILAALIVIAAGLMHTIERTRGARESDPAEGLSPVSRTMLNPLKKLYTEIETAAASNPSSFLGEEAKGEAMRLLKQSAASLRVRDRLHKDNQGAFAANKGISELEASLGSATNEEERNTLLSALASRRQELGHYSAIEPAIARIDASIRQAEAAMAELKARMATAGSAGAASAQSDELRDALGRMRALSASMIEVQELQAGS